MAGGLWTLTRALRGTRPRRLPLLGLLFLVMLPTALRAEGIDVVVTIKPIHSLVARVMEGVAVPTLLVEGSASLTCGGSP